MLKAIVIGATGLIGKKLVEQLLANKLYSEVKVFHRRTTGISNQKLREFIIDFEKLDLYANDIEGDVLFSVLGTTLKTAGSKEKQYNIDYHYQFNFAKIAANNSVSNYILLSSIGANAKSSVFYSKMKGELDEAVRELPFDHISILRPSMLDGDRDEFRLTEKIFTPIMRALIFVPCWKKYRPIKDVAVAKAMLNAVQDNNTSYRIYESNSIFLLADLK